MRHSWHDPHIVRTGKSLLRVLYMTLGIFLALFVVFRIGSAFYVSYISENQLQAFHAGIAQDEEYLMVQGDDVARNDRLIGELLEGNRNDLLHTLKQEQETRSIGLMGVANSGGVMVGRTLSRGKYGDNVFLTAPAGRVVAQGKSAQSIELTGFNNEIFMTTARPIMAEGEMIGGLFANYLLDDAYALRFRDTYMSLDVQIVFYTKAYGIYGDSFSDQNIRKLLSSYFNIASEWIRDGSSGKTISLGNGISYLVENVVFPGLEQSPGGALILIPRKDISAVANTVTAFFTLFAFLLLAISQHMRTAREERGWRYHVMLICAALPVFVLAFFAFHAQNIGRLRLEHIPYILYNSTIRLQPESGIYTVGFEQEFSVVIDTGDEPINAVNIALNFDSDAIEMKSFRMASSTCSYIIENTIDQNAGIAQVSCVVLNTETGRRSLPIATVVVSPKRTGKFELSFDPNLTKVLANDGLGTNVLRMSQDGSYRVENFNISFGATASTTVLTQSEALSFVVFSSTHSNESRWYNLDKAHFVWRGKPDAVYRYSFDGSSATNPSNEHTIQGSSVDIRIPGDGVYYFHLQLVSGGPVAHYRVQSDMTPPNIIAMNISQDRIFAGDVARFSFDAEDNVSGIQRNYYVDLGNRLFLPIGSQLFIPFLEVGNQKITLRVYDDAGNYSERTRFVRVEKR